MQSDDFFPVDATKTYALSGWARSGDEFGLRFQPANQQSFGIVAYDVDLLPISPQHVLRFPGATDTTLAAMLNPGDAAIVLTNATGWSNAEGTSALTRGVAWYGYMDSTGTTYSDYTYTRNVALGEVLFMHRRTQHAGLRNRSDRIRWSFDLRYHPIGQPTGRPWFPGFVARSRTHPETELHDPEVWAESWRAARSALAQGEDVAFNRWKKGDPRCA